MSARLSPLAAPSPLWIALHLYRLPLDARLIRWPISPPEGCAIVEQHRIVCVDAMAWALGVRPGMGEVSARSTAPALLCLPRDPALERQSLQDAALALSRYTPSIAQASDDTLLLEVRASLNWAGGALRLCHKLRATLRDQALHGRWGMAPSAQAAWWFALQPPGTTRRVLTTSRRDSRLDALSLAGLAQADPIRDWLHELGCRHLFQLRALPRAGLRRRGGGTLLQAVDQAYGQATETWPWLPLPVTLQQRQDFDQPLQHHAHLLHGARRLASSACGWLAAGHRAATGIELTLAHDSAWHGAPAVPPTRLTLHVLEPVADVDHLCRLLDHKLQSLTLPGPVHAMSLNLSRIVEHQPRHASFLAEPTRHDSARAQLLEILTARLGHTCLRIPSPRADHRPEYTNHWVDLTQAPTRRRSARAPATAAPHVHAIRRPLWLLATPVALTERAHRPVYGSQSLKLIQGPERIETGWWDSDQSARDYFVACDAQQVHYWIYRQYGTDSVRWFLHGLFA